jgi:AcrR family transcriptional regulator
MPRAVDHAERRARLVEVTARHIADVGLDNVRLRDVARHAGSTTGMVSHYFVDKRALLLSTFRSRTEGARRLVLQGLEDGLTRLEAIIEAVLPIDDERTLNWQVWLAFWGAAVGDNDLAAEQRHRYQLFTDDLGEGVRAAQHDGTLRPDIDPQQTARYLAALLDGIAVQALFAPELWPPGEQRRFIAEHLRPLRPVEARTAVTGRRRTTPTRQPGDL